MISGERAAALNLANERDAADPAAPVLIDHAPWLDAANRAGDRRSRAGLDRAPIGPLQPIAPECAETGSAALDLARSAGLFPALWLLDAASREQFRFGRLRSNGSAGSRQVEIVARAKLPLDDMPPTPDRRVPRVG